jgi:hypothetical protein
MHKSPWIHLCRRPLVPTAARWDSGMVAAAPRFCPVASSAVGPVLGSTLKSPLRLGTGTTPPRPALLVTRKSAGRQVQSVRGTHLAG